MVEFCPSCKGRTIGEFLSNRTWPPVFLKMSCHQTVKGHRQLSHWRQNLVRFSHFSRECRVNTPPQIWESHDSGQMPWWINNSWFLIPESGYTDGLVQDSSNCSALAMELLQSSTKLPIQSCIEAYSSCSCKHRADYSIIPFKINGSLWGFIVHVIQRIALHIELGLTKQWKFCDATWRHLSSLPLAKSMFHWFMIPSHYLN